MISIQIKAWPEKESTANSSPSIWILAKSLYLYLFILASEVRPSTQSDVRNNKMKKKLT